MRYLRQQLQSLIEAKSTKSISSKRVSSSKKSGSVKKTKMPDLPLDYGEYLVTLVDGTRFACKLQYFYPGKEGSNLVKIIFDFQDHNAKTGEVNSGQLVVENFTDGRNKELLTKDGKLFNAVLGYDVIGTVKSIASITSREFDDIQKELDSPFVKKRDEVARLKAGKKAKETAWETDGDDPHYGQGYNPPPWYRLELEGGETIVVQRYKSVKDSLYARNTGMRDRDVWSFTNGDGEVSVVVKNVKETEGQDEGYYGKRYVVDYGKWKGKSIVGKFVKSIKGFVKPPK
jgi:hypothetical protein